MRSIRFEALKRRGWWPFSLAVSSGSPSTRRSLPLWAHCWRVIFAGIMLALAAANITAQYLTSHALRTKGLSPPERYEQLILAAKFYPLDRNIREAPEGWRLYWNTYVSERMKGR